MNFKALTVMVSFVLLTACGGGGGSSSGSYLAVTGVKENEVGKPVKTVCLNNVADATANNTNGQLVAEALSRFYFITGQYQITSSNYQSCSVLPGALQVSVDYYNNTILPWVRANPASSVSSNTGGTSGTNTSGSSSNAPSGTGIQYTSWSGSSNGTGIRDFGGNVFGARSSDGQIYYWPGNGVEIKLNGLTVNAANVYSSAGKIGYVGLADGTSGGRVAAFYCADGGEMTITGTSSGWYHACASAQGNGTPSTPGTNSGSTTTPSPILYGAISYGQDSSGSQAVGLTYSGSSQTEADALANQSCSQKSGGSITCGVVLNIVGRGMCGALAWNDKGWSATTNIGLAATQLSAMSGCAGKTGATCTVAASACNAD